MTKANSTETLPKASGVSVGLLGSLCLVLVGLIVARHIIAPLILFLLFWSSVALIAYGMLKAATHTGMSLTLKNTFILLVIVALISYIIVLQSGKAISSRLPSF